MTFHLLREAKAEFSEAVSWYKAKELGLGKRFRDEITQVFGKIMANPLLWRERPGGYRRVNCPTFPYYIPYFIRGQKIIVAAVAHERRRPHYWQDRRGI